jgi:PAS domain S-box-containing protein
MDLSLARKADRKSAHLNLAGESEILEITNLFQKIILKTSQEIHLVLAESGQIVEVHAGPCTEHSFNKQDLIGKLAIEFVHLDDKKMFSQRLKEKSHDVKKFEMRFCLRGGTFNHLTCSIYFDQEAHQIILSAIDLTTINRNSSDRDSNNEVIDLQKMNKRLELAVRAVKFGVWDWDYKNNNLVWDDYMYDLFEANKNDFEHAYAAFEKHLVPADAQRISDELQNVFLQKKSEFHSQFLIKTNLGRLKRIAVAALCFYDEKGQIERLVGNNWDLTEQQNIQTRLHDIETEIQNFFNMSVDLLCVASLDGYFKRVNPAFTNVLGWSAEELVSRPFIDFVHPEDVAATLLEAQKLSTEGGNTLHFQNRYRTKSGQFRLFSWVTTADMKNKLLYCVVRDLTEIKEAELKMLQSAKMATLGEMAAGIAHEINNPLAIIKGKADSITRGLSLGRLDEKKMATDLSLISRTVDRIAKIIIGLRSFSRDSSKEAKAFVDLRKVIEESTEFCQERFRSEQVTLEMSCDERIELQCRPVQIGQVILNLLNNSYDAVQSLKTKWVKISAEKRPGQVIISVTDSGSGIPDSIAEKMMQPFFTSKEVGKGTGLGLSISRGIIQDHGGKFYFDKESKNTRFVIELPIEES